VTENELESVREQQTDGFYDVVATDAFRCWGSERSRRSIFHLPQASSQAREVGRRFCFDFEFSFEYQKDTLCLASSIMTAQLLAASRLFITYF
jgi:hypothetical protein